MASINTYLTKIQNAVYGEEVRGSIHDAIKAINDENVTVQAACERAKTAAEESKAAAQSAMQSATTSQSAVSKLAQTTEENTEKVLAAAEKIEKSTAELMGLSIGNPLLDSSNDAIKDSNGNEIFGRYTLQTADGVNDLRKRTDTLEFQARELENARQTLTDKVSSLLEFREDILDGTGIGIPLLDSSGNAIMDNLQQNVCGRLMIPSMTDVLALSQKLAALDAVVTSILSWNLNSRVSSLESIN